MFKKLYAKIDELKMLTRTSFNTQTNEHYNTRAAFNKLYDEHKSKINSMEKIIASQQRTIEQLTNALKDKYEHGLFIFSDDCKIPMVIRNGKEVIGKYTNWFRIEWKLGEAPYIETEEMVGTFGDTEDSYDK